MIKKQTDEGQCIRNPNNTSTKKCCIFPGLYYNMAIPVVISGKYRQEGDQLWNFRFRILFLPSKRTALTVQISRPPRSWPTPVSRRTPSSPRQRAKRISCGTTPRRRSTCSKPAPSSAPSRPSVTRSWPSARKSRRNSRKFSPPMWARLWTSRRWPGSSRPPCRERTFPATPWRWAR